MQRPLNASALVRRGAGCGRSALPVHVPGGSAAALWVIWVFAPVLALGADPLAKPAFLRAANRPWDGGETILVTIGLSPDDVPDAEPKRVERYLLQRVGEFHGLYEDLPPIVPEKSDYRRGWVEVSVGGCQTGEPYFFRAWAVGPGQLRSGFVETSEPVVAMREWFDGGRLWLLIITSVIGGSVILFILLARSGRELKVRKIAGLEAVEEAVGRATEMGRPVLFIPGIQDMNEIQTIAGLTILSRVAEQAAQYDAALDIPTSKSLVMTAARETVQAAYLSAGRPDAYNEDRIYYVTDEQFGYVAYLSGKMVREKPAACFYLGSFFAESLILAETGNSIGAIQIAGTAQPAQLPFFVAACDYTLIGEEFFAASAYLSRDPVQLGSLKGQDVGKLIVGGLLLAGCALVTAAQLTSAEWVHAVAGFLKDTVLQSRS